VNHLSDLRRYSKEVEEKIFDFINWQKNSKGRLTNLPKIEGSNKEIFFQEWKIRLKNAEVEIYSARDISSNMIQLINGSLLHENLISECLENTLPNVKTLTKTWQESLKKKVGQKKSLSKIDLECHWHFLVKPYGKWLILRCLLNTTSEVLPVLNNVLFTKWMCIRPKNPPECKARIDICELQH